MLAIVSRMTWRPKGEEDIYWVTIPSPNGRPSKAIVENKTVQAFTHLFKAATMLQNRNNAIVAKTPYTAGWIEVKGNL